MPYDSETDLVGVVARHADGCPVCKGQACRCGPLGYRAGVLDWEAGAWVFSPLFDTLAEAQDWQRVANARLESGHGAPAPVSSANKRDDEAQRSEQLFWWAFCYVGLGFLAVALAFFLVDIGG